MINEIKEEPRIGVFVCWCGANIGAVVDVPAFRPLIGMDKEEIIGMAKRIGTYELSIDAAICCTLSPKKPSTKSVRKLIKEQESRIKGLETLISNAVKNKERVII